MVELQEWMQILDERNALREAIQRVRELHKGNEVNTDYGSWNRCNCCWVRYPCLTVKALDGEK